MRSATAGFGCRRRQRIRFNWSEWIGTLPMSSTERPLSTLFRIEFGRHGAACLPRPGAATWQLGSALRPIRGLAARLRKSSGRQSLVGNPPLNGRAPETRGLADIAVRDEPRPLSNHLRHTLL